MVTGYGSLEGIYRGPLKTDLTEQNTLFVGCSLEQEIDLLYALAEYHNAFPEGRRSIFVTNALPNRFDEAKLADHGINSVLLVSDYDKFYDAFATLGKQAEKRTQSLISLYSSQRLDTDKSVNLRFLLRDPTGPKACIPYFYVRRDIEDAILRATEATHLSLLRGRRYAGKTLLLRSLAAAARSRNVYLFASHTRVSDEVLDELMGIKNGLFLFHTNTLSSDSAISLVRRLDTFTQNNSTAIVAVNRTEPDIVGALVRHVDDQFDFELDVSLSRHECDEINRRLDALGILRFICRKTLLDNTFTLLEQYPAIKSDLARDHNPSEKEVEVLLVTAVVDKVYSSLATALEVRTTELFSLCERLAPILELVDTSRSELRDTNSRYKIVANSKIGLALQIRNEATKRGFAWLSERIGNAVKRLISLPTFKSIGHSMYMFDAINYVLSQTVHAGEQTGYRPVVLSLYEHLQPILNRSADYWLQRAKAVLSLEERKEALLDGIDYALKAYHEAERDRTIDNAEFIIALLYGKLCSVTEFKEHEYAKHPSRNNLNNIL